MGTWLNGRHIPRDLNTVVTVDGDTEQAWDGKVKNLVYDVDSMAWIAETQSEGGGGGSGATAANQVTGNASLASIDTKLSTLTGAFNAPANTDAVTVTYPNGTTEVYAFRTGGSGGSVVSTLTLIYTDASKLSLTSAVRT